MREGGILLHISSLPASGPIGTLGSAAYAFVDFLEASGMRIWQTLPIGPTGYGSSPYQSASAYAGNPLLIDLGDIQPASANPARVPFETLETDKHAQLFEAFTRMDDTERAKLDAFAREEHWVKDYALFMALKEHFGGRIWRDWPDRDIRDRKRAAIEKYASLLHERTQYHIYTQMRFFQQWFALKSYANAHNVLLFGDMPIYVAEDSADTWTNPRAFLLDRDKKPTLVAGVPPDYFSEDGQKWGNPLYNWRYLRLTKYRWWVDRMRHAFRLFDRVRVDHFIGFANYYAIPARAPNARVGTWRVGPNMRLFRRLMRELGDTPIVAEDLGVVSERVKQLMRACGYPGMRVLQFAFDDGVDGMFNPRNYPENCVAYTGTHDNDTSLGWWINATAQQQANAQSLIGIDPQGDIARQMIQSVFASRANTAIIPMQDALGLSGTCRMNTPGTVGGDNWRWRVTKDMLNQDLAMTLRAINRAAGRE